MNAASTFLIRSTGRPRGFALLDGAGTVLAQFVQPHWFRQAMEGTLGGQAVSIVPQGTWKRNFSVQVDGRPAGAITTRPWGGLRLSLLKADGSPVELEFARKGTWSTAHVLRIGKDHVLLELKPRFNWKTFSLDHHVSVQGTGLTPEQLPLALALSGFCARLVRQRQAAAAA
jgi:hypothetical protein